MVKKLKYKVGDKLSFRFAGSTIKGTVERIMKSDSVYSIHKTRYRMYDGEYYYPVQPEDVIKKIK